MNNLNMRRVLKGRTLRAAEGLAPVQPPATPAAPAQPNSLLSNPDYSMINNPGYSMINNPGATLLSRPDVPSASALPASGAGSPTYTMNGAIPFGSPVNGQSVKHANAEGLPYQEAQRTQKRPFGLRNGGEVRMEGGGMWDTLRSAFSTKAPRFSPTATLGIRGKVGGDLVTGHGGAVPGKGKGDKIPAKYEPGEFVVSNAMLDAKPSLRGELRALRKKVLAKQGMTPAEADAKALRGTGLRARVGVAPQDSFYGGGLTPAQRAEMAANVNTARNTALPPSPGTMTQGPAGVTPPGGHYPTGQALVPQGTAARVVDGRALVTTADAGRGHSAGPTNMARDPRTIYQGSNTSGKFEVAARPVDPRVIEGQTRFVATPSTGADAAPVNRNVPAGGSAEAKAFRNRHAMPANAGPANAPAGYRSGYRSGVATAKILKKVPIVGQALSAAAEAGDVIDVARDKETSKIDVATQAAEGASKLAGASLGMTAGAAVGGPLAPLTALAGGAAGYYAPELIIKAARYASGQDTDTPIERMRARRDAPSAPSPTAPDANISDAILASEAGKRKSSQLRMAEAPAVAANSAVSNDDRKQSDAMLNSVMGRRGGTDLRNADINLNLLAGDQNTRDTANAAWAQRGAGIRVDAGPNGTPTFSNSTGPEKMRYTGVDGKPTNEYRNTQRYAEGVVVAQKEKALGDKMERDRYMQEAASGNPAYAAPAQRWLAQKALTENQAIEKDKTNALREGHQMDYEGRMAPVRAAEAQRERMRKILEAASGKDGGKPIDPTALALQVGDKDLVKVFQDIKAGELASTTSEQNLGDKRRDDLAKEFTVFTKNKNGENVADPRASAESLNMLRSIIPGLTSADAATREAAMPDARALHGIFANARNQDPVGWEAMKFWENKRPQLNDLPDARESSVEELSGLSGPLTMNASNGDTLLKQKDGRVLNLGVLDSKQRKLLDDAQQRGWGK